MSKKGRSKVSTEQRKAIASGKLARKTHREIGVELGLAQTTVDHQARDPRTVTMVLNMRQQSWADFAEMWRDAMKGLKGAIKSKNRVEARNGRDQLLRYMTVGDPPLYRVGDEGTTGGDFTLEELLITLRRYSKAG